MRIFIKINENNVITDYGIPLSDSHIPLDNSIEISTDIDIDLDTLIFNYKYVNEELEELSEAEKEYYNPSITPTTDELLKLQQNKINLLQKDNKELKEITKEQDRLLVELAYSQTLQNI